jgi:extradiol dioxygenase family protein
LKEHAFVGFPVTDFAKARRFYGEILHDLGAAVAYLKSKEVVVHGAGVEMVALARARKPILDAGASCCQLSDQA